MMFTRDSRLSVVGGVNNTNDDRKPGQTDNWNPNWQSAGRATMASGGIDYLWNSRLRDWKVEENVMARHKRGDMSSTWDMSFTTDLVMHSRRGYADSRLNSDDLVWNARLAKSIMHGNLTFAVDGFDILGRLSNVRLTMNSQGRTEQRFNTLPRYAMLHVIYRLNLQPKSR